VMKKACFIGGWLVAFDAADPVPGHCADRRSVPLMISASSITSQLLAVAQDMPHRDDTDVVMTRPA
jgi:hypothetical protein